MIMPADGLPRRVAPPSAAHEAARRFAARAGDVILHFYPDYPEGAWCSREDPAMGDAGGAVWTKVPNRYFLRDDMGIPETCETVLHEFCHLKQLGISQPNEAGATAFGSRWVGAVLLAGEFSRWNEEALRYGTTDGHAALEGGDTAPSLELTARAPLHPPPPGLCHPERSLTRCRKTRKRTATWTSRPFSPNCAGATAEGSSRPRRRASASSRARCRSMPPFRRTSNGSRSTSADPTAPAGGN